MMQGYVGWGGASRLGVARILRGRRDFRVRVGVLPGTMFNPRLPWLRAVERTVLAAILMLATPSARASLTVLVGEPYGSFGTMMPVGHLSVYLDRVCAEGPLRLRMCRAGEAQGAVVARYHQIGDLDWVATPVLEFLYATDRVEEIPAYVTPALAGEMRASYRRRYLGAVVPDGREREKALDEWVETAGVAFDRRLWGYEVTTTREQDEAFVGWMNAETNRHRYRLGGANCADFGADVVNFYYPAARVRASRVADFGVMSPKQVARRLAAYAGARPEMKLRVIEVAQVPGSLRRSRPVRGGAEGCLKTKRYLATLLVVQPEVPVALTAMYLSRGRWQVGKGAERVAADEFMRKVPGGVGAGNQTEGDGSAEATMR